MAFYRRFQIMLLIDGAWVDITDDVRQSEPITITRGGMDEQRRPTPAKCRYLLDNRSRDYSPRNPLSDYYGLLGRNTPTLIRALLAEDLFAGATTDGWGSADPCGIRDTDYPWTAVGGAASDFQEAGGNATHLISAANSSRYTYLSDVAYRDVGVLVQCTVAVNDVTGGAIEPANILLRGSGSAYYMVRVSVSTAEVLTVAVMTEAAVVVEAAVTVTGVVDAASSKTISVRAECEGEILRVRVWKTADPEPGEWHLTGESRTYLAAGWVGVRSGLAASNSNTPVTFTYHRVEVYSPQFAGEVAKWPQSRDTTGAERTVAVEAFDVFQRLRQGVAALASALRLGIQGMTVPAVAYWPGEDGRDSTVVASDSPAQPMAVTGSPDFASSDDFACSSELLTLTNAALFGVVPEYTPTAGQSQVRFLLSIPAAGAVNNEKICRVMTTGGTTGLWDLLYGTGGTITLNIYDPAGALLVTTGAVAFSLNGRAVRVSLELTQDGADIDWALSTLEASASASAGGISATLAGRTYGRVDWINIGGDAQFTNVTVGHITVEKQVTSIFALLPELIAYLGEAAEARVLKLCQQQGLTAYVGTGSPAGQAMGAQLPGKFLALLEQCPAADLGVLATCRGEVAIRYDRLNYAYNQTAQVVIDAANYELDEFEPVDDNFLTRNKITAKRINGSEYTATQTTGSLAAVDPIDGGVGVYDDTATLNLYTDLLLPDAAGYRLLQGTVDEPRFPDLSVNLANSHIRGKEQTTRALIDLNLGERLQVDNAASSDLYDTVDLYTNGLTVRLSTFTHRVTANCSPYDPYRIAELDAATLVLDADTELDEDLDTTETGVTVEITDGAIWTDVDGDYDVDVGGERQTVTAVSGAASPQTFTVTRSVNGIVKSHSNGAAVRLADPHYLAGW